MPWMSKGDPDAKWVNYSVKLDPQLNNVFLSYWESVKDEGLTRGATLRLLVSAGLQTVWGSDDIMMATIQSNAKALAIERFGEIMDEAMRVYRDPDFDIRREVQNAKSKDV
jgi:hypothetical protein